MADQDVFCSSKNILTGAPDSGQNKDSGEKVSENIHDKQTDFANKFRRLRACARCHRLKMRCVFEDPNYESCTRCFKAGLRCSATVDPTSAMAKPRPRKKCKIKGTGPLVNLQVSINEANKYIKTFQEENYSEVDAELNEENLAMLQDQLAEVQRLLAHTLAIHRRRNSTNEADRREANTINSIKAGSVKSVPGLPWISKDANIVKELIKIGIITDTETSQRLEYFKTELYPYWPCISFPKHYTYSWLLDNEPLLLLGCITVTTLNEPDLHDTLLYYLEEALSLRVAITGNITVSMIDVYSILSLWCSPPKKWGSYKHQMSLMMALSLTLCLDIGNEACKHSSTVLTDDSFDKQMVRTYMSVYASCGSLGLSLPKFKVVNWTPVHEKCSHLLIKGETNQSDKFLHFFTRLVSIGEEIFQFFCPNGFNKKLSLANTQPKGTSKEFKITNNELRSTMIGYEQRMQTLARDSKLFSTSSKAKNLLSIIYYQLLMTMYDYVVCHVLDKREVVTEVYLQTLTRLVKASEKVIESFTQLCNQTSNFPTFFYYRPMHALVALIRARLLIKAQHLDLDVDVEKDYKKVCASIKNISSRSIVAKKMSVILTRVSKWMKVSNKFDKTGSTNLMMDLLNELGKEKAVESIKIDLNVADQGDNMNLSDKSKIRLNNPRDCNDNIYNSFPDLVASSISMRPTSSVEGSSSTISMPSPIGFSSSEYSQTDEANRSSLKRAKNTDVQTTSEHPLVQLDTTLDDLTDIQKQQEFLHGLFSQIDSDIMGAEDQVSDTNLATPIPFMFDFLGSGPQASELPILEDWYKNL